MICPNRGLQPYYSHAAIRLPPKNPPYRDVRPLEGKIPSRGHFMPQVWSKTNPLEGA